MSISTDRGDDGRHDNPVALPETVRSLALRLGAMNDTAAFSVVLAQRGTMRGGPTSRWMWFRAMQTIDLCGPNFEWHASTGPFGMIRVVDALRDGEAELDVRALRYLRIGGVRGGRDAAKGEIMRYLAELAWSPDAILHNHALSWSVGDEQTLRVSAECRGVRAEVELRLDENGRVGSVFAPDRPRMEGSRFVERPWHGRLFDYRQHEGRCLPFRGEVGWVLDGYDVVVWRGELLSWRLS
jgi:hypothetical protein